MGLKSLVIFYSISLVVIFAMYYSFICRPRIKQLFVGDKTKPKKDTKKKKRKNVEVGELLYLEKKFNLNREKLNWKSLAFWISFIDAFIISLVVFIIELIKVAIVIKLVIAFFLLFALIYAIYEIYGRYLQNKQEKED